MPNSNQLESNSASRDIPFFCRCLIDCAGGVENSTCQLAPDAKCFKKISVDNYGVVNIRAGCLPSPAEHIDQCNKLAYPDFEYIIDLQCCNNASMCNDHLNMEYPATESPGDGDLAAANEGNVALIIAVVCCLFVLFVTAIFVSCFRYRRREKRFKKEIEEENRNFSLFYDENGRPAGGAMSPLDPTMSGAGMPLLVQRTISRQIEIVKEIGRGRYGTVKLGRWRDENVALKIFFSKDEDSWFRETEIYQTVMLRHDNILGFIAADISGTDSWTQLFLITDYHENGSLYDYLHNTILDVSQAVKIMYSACSGLAHLHTEITGTQGKPAIAHRDIKSKNILVKRDGQCCIADMGLAVKYSRDIGRVNIGSYEKSRRQGTRRYMAPEVILQSYHPDSFDAYKASDVYSFALVMWEVASRTTVKGCVDIYHPPYYDVVRSDPDVDEMKKVVVDDNIRPNVLSEWSSHQVMGVYAMTMQECWVARHESRLSMLRVRKTLSALHEVRDKPVNDSLTESESDRKPSASSTLSTTSNPPTDDPNIIPLEPPRQSTFVI